MVYVEKNPDGSYVIASTDAEDDVSLRHKLPSEEELKRKLRAEYKLPQRTLERALLDLDDDGSAMIQTESKQSDRL